MQSNQPGIMDFNPRFRNMQIIAGTQCVQSGIVVNAFDSVGIRTRVEIYADVVVFAHEPLQERRVQ